MEALPFDTYPNRGSEPFHLKKGYNTRLEDGPEFMRLTRQTACAYCNSDFLGGYETWLTMALDHVVPTSVCKEKNIPPEWADDFSNMVLSCGACNGLRNRYTYIKSILLPLSRESFVEMRNCIFVERKDLILAAREKERTEFHKLLREFKRTSPLGADS